MIRPLMLTLLTGASLLPLGAAAAQVAEPAAPTTAAPLTPAPPTDDQRPEGLEDIVVTAQRREESLQKVPVAVTAISTAQLADLRVTNIRDLASLAPGLQIITQGRQTVPTVNIRGVASGSTNVAVDPKVGIYIDGVYVGRVVGSIFDLADIQRVEVLRGPQGTLFGRNATGGAISLTTVAPSGELGVAGNVSYGNFDAKRLRVSVDLPSFGPFSARVSYLHDEIEGDIRNLLAGQVYDLSRRSPETGIIRAASRLGGRNIDGALVGVRGDFGAVVLDYRFDYTDQRSVGRAVQSFGVLPTDALAPLLNPIIGFQPQFGGFTNISETRLGAVANNSSVDHIRTQGHSLTLNVEATDSLSLKSITAYRKLDQDPSTYDLGASGGLRFTRAQFLGLATPGLTPAQRQAIILNPANRPGPNDNFYSIFNAYQNKQRQVSQELQLSLDKDAFDLIGGAFFFHEHAPTTNFLGTVATLANGVYIPTPGIDRAVTRVRTDNDSFAFYAQGTLHLTDRLDLTGGLRYTIDDRGTDVRELSGANPGSLGVGNFKASFTRTNYTAIVTYRPTDAITAYAKTSSAYVAGGVVNGSIFQPEDLTAYEIGLKSQLFDNRLRANFAVYQNDYEDLQVQNFANGISIFANAGKARIRGFEAEVEAIPVEGLSLSGNVSHVDIDFKSFILSGIEVASVARISGLSPWSGRVAVGYTAPDFANGSHIAARVDANYRSSAPLGPLPITLANGQRAPLDAFSTADSYWLVNGRVGLADIPIGGGQVSISAFGANLFDKNYINYGAQVFQLAVAFERGRTYGVELGFSF